LPKSNHAKIFLRHLLQRSFIERVKLLLSSQATGYDKRLHQPECSLKILIYEIGKALFPETPALARKSQFFLASVLNVCYKLNNFVVY
jgi:hypothetical protein